MKRVSNHNDDDDDDDDDDQNGDELDEDGKRVDLIICNKFHMYTIAFLDNVILSALSLYTYFTIITISSTTTVIICRITIIILKHYMIIILSPPKYYIISITLF